MLKRLFVIVSALHTHFYADTVSIPVSSEQISVSVVNADMPAPEIVRCCLVDSVAIINVIVGRHIGQLTIMLRFCVCAGIGTRSEIICVVDYNTFRIVLTVSVRVTD